MPCHWHSLQNTTPSCVSTPTFNYKDVWWALAAQLNHGGRRLVYGFNVGRRKEGKHDTGLSGTVESSDSAELFVDGKGRRGRRGWKEDVDFHEVVKGNGMREGSVKERRGRRSPVGLTFTNGGSTVTGLRL